MKCMKGLLILFAVMSGPTVYAEDLTSDTRICSPSPEVCFDGTVRWDKNQRTISISGQMVKTPPKGTLRFYFRGVTGGGQTVVHDTEIAFRGVGREYLDKRIIPPYSSEVTWTLSGVDYLPAP